MILADTSVWIEFTPGRIGIETEVLKLLATCGPVHALPRLCDPMPTRLYLEAAEIYSTGRRKGYTIRSAIDCLIAAVAIECGVAVMHRDRDFDTIARFTGLRVRR